jgi:hypothetical protein
MRTKPHPRRFWLLFVPLVAAGVLAIAGCSASTSKSGSSTAPRVTPTGGNAQGEGGGQAPPAAPSAPAPASCADLTRAWTTAAASSPGQSQPDGAKLSSIKWTPQRCWDQVVFHIPGGHSVGYNAHYGRVTTNGKGDTVNVAGTSFQLTVASWNTGTWRTRQTLIADTGATALRQVVYAGSDRRLDRRRFLRPLVTRREMGVFLPPSRACS